MTLHDKLDLAIKLVGLAAGLAWFIWRGLFQPRVNLRQSVWVISNSDSQSVLHVRIQIENLGEVFHKLCKVRINAYNPLDQERLAFLDKLGGEKADGTKFSSGCIDEQIAAPPEGSKKSVLLGPLLEKDCEVSNEIRSHEIEVITATVLINHRPGEKLKWVVIGSQVTRSGDTHILERDGLQWRGFTLVDLTNTTGRQGDGEKG